MLIPCGGWAGSLARLLVFLFLGLRLAPLIDGEVLILPMLGAAGLARWQLLHWVVQVHGQNGGNPIGSVRVVGERRAPVGQDQIQIDDVVGAPAGVGVHLPAAPGVVGFGPVEALARPAALRELGSVVLEGRDLPCFLGVIPHGPPAVLDGIVQECILTTR